MTTKTDNYRERVERARARAEAAHKGPWHIHEGDLVDANHQDVFDDWEEAYGPNSDEVGPDTTFICSAQEDVIFLTDAIDALIKERDQAESTAHTIVQNTLHEMDDLHVAKDALARENERLREALQRAQTDFERIARGVIAPERAADMSAQEIAAALANAPTPNDKGLK